MTGTELRRALFDLGTENGGVEVVVGTHADEIDELAGGEQLLDTVPLAGDVDCRPPAESRFEHRERTREIVRTGVDGGVLAYARRIDEVQFAVGDEDVFGLEI